VPFVSFGEVYPTELELDVFGSQQQSNSLYEWAQRMTIEPYVVLVGIRFWGAIIQNQ